MIGNLILKYKDVTDLDRTISMDLQIYFKNINFDKNCLKLHRLVCWEDCKNIINICFILERPGLLIGRKGSLINNIRLYLSKELKKEIKTHIKETISPWIFGNEYNEYLEYNESK